MSQKKYICEKCNFYSDNKKDHTKHLHTVKHKKIQCVPPPIKECVIKYKCEKCQQTLTPKGDDCCVFCTYSTHKCPSKQTK